MLLTSKSVDLSVISDHAIHAHYRWDQNPINDTSIHNFSINYHRWDHNPMVGDHGCVRENEYCVWLTFHSNPEHSHINMAQKS